MFSMSFNPYNSERFVFLRRSDSMLYFHFVESGNLDYIHHSILNLLVYKMSLIILLNSQDDTTL